MSERPGQNEELPRRVGGPPCACEGALWGGTVQPEMRVAGCRRWTPFGGGPGVLARAANRGDMHGYTRPRHDGAVVVLLIRSQAGGRVAPVHCNTLVHRRHMGACRRPAAALRRAGGTVLPQRRLTPPVAHIRLALVSSLVSFRSLSSFLFLSYMVSLSLSLCLSVCLSLSLCLSLALSLSFSLLLSPCLCIYLSPLSLPPCAAFCAGPPGRRCCWWCSPRAPRSRQVQVQPGRSPTRGPTMFTCTAGPSSWKRTASSGYPASTSQRSSSNSPGSRSCGGPLSRPTWPACARCTLHASHVPRVVGQQVRN